MFRRSVIPYLSSQSGGVAVWASLMMPVIFMGAAISIDVARLYNMDNDLQSAADAMARAAAAELDQTPDSLIRAERAVTSLLDNTQSFSVDGPGRIEAGSIRFLKALPSHDDTPILSTLETDKPEEARFVEVSVAPETVSTLFPATAQLTGVESQLSAVSVATLERGVCGSAPVFFCNPFEETEENLATALESRSIRRRLVQFKSGSGGQKIGPGNFGYIDPFGGTGSGSEIRDAIGRVQSKVCVFASRGLTTRPGNVSSMRHAFNTRFDMYSGPYKSSAKDPQYAPAQNVTRGYSGSPCKEKADPKSMGLPRDACFLDGTCSGPIGDGDWDFVNYVRINHNAPSSLEIDGTRYYFDYGTQSVTPKDIPTRYEVYRWEIDTDSIPGASTYGMSSTPEEGIPQCHADGPSKSELDRRVIYAAIVNCKAAQKAGIKFNGKTSGIPVDEFVKVFLTEPMGNGKDAIIWGEMIEPVSFGRDAAARDRIEIVR